MTAANVTTYTDSRGLLGVSLSADGENSAANVTAQQVSTEVYLTANDATGVSLTAKNQGQAEGSVTGVHAWSHEGGAAGVTVSAEGQGFAGIDVTGEGGIDVSGTGSVTGADASAEGAGSVAQVVVSYDIEANGSLDTAASATGAHVEAKDQG